MEENESNIRERKAIIVILTIVLLVTAYMGFNSIKLNNVAKKSIQTANIAKNMHFAVGGEASGIKLLATGVLVMGLDREDTSLKVGDIILEVNDTKIATDDELISFTKKSMRRKFKT